MDDPLGAREHGAGIDPERLRQPIEARHHPERLVGRRRRHLGQRDTTLRIDGHEIREGAADIDADPKHRLSSILAETNPSVYVARRAPAPCAACRHPSRRHHPSAR